MRRWVIGAALAVAVGGCAPEPVDVGREDPVGFDDVGLPDATIAPAPQPTAPPPSSPSPSPPPSPPPRSPPSPSPAPTIDDTPAPTTGDTPAPTTGDTHPVALTWDGIDLRLPSAATELVGFHQSNHDGARDLQAYEGVVPFVVLESRERGTGMRGASDIVVDPATELRAPVTGTVLRAGTYTLYCDEVDDFLVIEPDGRPGIEVKLLHIDGVQVTAGERVEAGETVVAPRPTKLPFASQVDEVSGPENWPHVHLEVVDTAIPDRPNENSGSDDC